MRSIVTGGAGFLGSHLCAYLLSQGHEVVCVDNLITGESANIIPLQENPRFSFLKLDITQPLSIEGEIDQIYNLASPASPPDYMKAPLETLWVGALGTKHCLELAVKHQATLLHASTSEVYGDPLEHPQKESYWGNVNPTGERSCYDESKRFAESLISIYRRKYPDLHFKIARIFNTYGPRMRPNDGRVVSNFITQALRGDDLTVYGDGTQTRSFCYVDDQIAGLMALMEHASFDGPVNIGNPNEFSMNELAEKVISLIGAKSALINKPLPSDDPKVRCPDISLAKAKLNWEPVVSLDEGLKRTVEWFTVSS